MIMGVRNWGDTTLFHPVPPSCLSIIDIHIYHERYEIST